MTKLTNWIREGIAKRAVAASFDPRNQMLLAAEDALAREAYTVAFTKQELAAVAKIPANWVRLDACLRFNVAGLTITLDLIGEGLPVPYKVKGSEYGGWGCKPLVAIPHGDLADRVQAHANDKEDYKRQRRDALAKVEALLGSVSTLKQLADIWPEGAPFYSVLSERPVLPPAIRVDEINAALGLPALAA